jgi:hypothetical protein
MIDKCLRHALVTLFGTPHCGTCDVHGRGCALSSAERRRVYINGGRWPCRSRDVRAPQDAEYERISRG